MNLPLSGIGSIVSAAKVAGKAISQVGDAIGFDEILRSKPTQEEHADVGNHPQSLPSQLIDEALKTLESFNLSQSSVLDIEIERDGFIRILEQTPTGGKAAAGRIENEQIANVLNSNAKIRQLSERIAASSSSSVTQLSIPSGVSPGSTNLSFHPVIGENERIWR